MTLDKAKIVFLIASLGLDGTSKIVLKLCELFKENYEIHIVTLKENPDLISLNIKPAGVSLYQFDFKNNFSYSLIEYVTNLLNGRKYRTTYKKLIDYIKYLNPNIIHCHTHPLDLMIINYSPFLSGLGLLYTDHSTRIKPNEYSLLNREGLAWVFRRMYKKFNVVAVSESVYKYHKEFNIVSKKKIHRIISNKIDANLFVPAAEKRSNIIRVIYVARLHKKKGHDTLIKAWSLIHSQQPCELVIVGGGEEEFELKRLIESQSLTHPIVLTGQSKDVLPYLQSSHFGVFPSLNEGLPLSLLEKMSCELPVIVSDIPELKFIVEDGVNGLLFEAGNVKGLAQKIQLFIDEPDLRMKLGIGARKSILEKFSTDSIKNDYENIYNKIINTSNQVTRY